MSLASPATQVRSRDPVSRARAATPPPSSTWTVRSAQAGASPAAPARLSPSTPPETGPSSFRVPSLVTARTPSVPASAVRPRRSCCSSICRLLLHILFFQAAFIAVCAGVAGMLRENGRPFSLSWYLGATDSSCQGQWIWADQTLEGCQAQADAIGAAHLTFEEQTGHCKYAREHCELSDGAIGQRVFHKVTLRHEIQFALVQCTEVLADWASECENALADFVAPVAAHVAESWLSAGKQWAKWLSARDEGETVHASAEELAAHFESRFAQIDEKLNERIAGVLHSSVVQQNIATPPGQAENVHSSQGQSAARIETQYRQLVETLKQERQAFSVGEQAHSADSAVQQENMRHIIQAAEARFVELLARIAELEGKTMQAIESRVADAIAQHSVVAAAEGAEQQAAIHPTLSPKNKEACPFVDLSLSARKRDNVPEAVLGVELQSIKCLVQTLGKELAQDALDVNVIHSASCADHPGCVSVGLNGLCCPTHQGQRLGCCSPAPEETSAFDVADEV